MRSRSVSEVLLSGLLDVPAAPARLQADWDRQTSLDLNLEPGDVEALSLHRTRMRWPDYRRCVDAAAQWTRGLGLPENFLPGSDVALMACRGARYHHDGSLYGGAAFCNLFLSEDKGLDLHFPAAGRRMPLTRGTLVIFDTGQPHAVIDRHQPGFDAAGFPPGRDGLLVFLTWELDIEQADLARVLDITFDIDPGTAARLDEGQLQRHGQPATVCPASGRWN